jgi:hypothetical protein
MSARAKRKRRDGLGWLLILLVFVLLAAGASAAILLRPPPLDEASLCRTDQPLRAHTLILVDATDRFDPRHRKRLDAAIKQERARLQPYDRLSILSLKPDRPQEPRILFSLCLPPDSRFANPLFENPKLIQQHWDERIGKALNSAERRAASSGGARVSPIAASIKAAAADPDFAQDIPHRRFVIVSDMLENDPDGFSIYRADADASHAADRPPALGGVDVRIVPLDRPGETTRQDDARKRFWAPFFNASGAASVRWDPTG